MGGEIRKMTFKEVLMEINEKYDKEYSLDTKVSEYIALQKAILFNNFVPLPQKEKAVERIRLSRLLVIKPERFN